MVIETDEEALCKFNETIKFEDGRYQVAWPCKHDDVCLPENFNLDIRRLRSLINQLKSNRILFGNYNQIIQEQLHQGIIEEVDLRICGD